MRTILIFFCYFVMSFNSLFAFDFADKEFFVSLRSNEVNLRTGPGPEYPIKFIYQLDGLPLKVLGEYENWYQVVDKDNDSGWLSKNLTTKSRNLIVINGTQIFFKDDNINSNPIFRLEENVILKYEKCKQNWCKAKINDRTGWIETQNVWGHD